MLPQSSQAAVARGSDAFQHFFGMQSHHAGLLEEDVGHIGGIACPFVRRIVGWVEGRSHAGLDEFQVHRAEAVPGKVIPGHAAAARIELSVHAETRLARALLKYEEPAKCRARPQTLLPPPPPLLSPLS